jgi:hypothetical protein
MFDSVQERRAALLISLHYVHVGLGYASCRNYVKLHNNSKGTGTAHTQDEGNTGVIKKRTRGVESFSSFENPCLIIGY